MAYSVTIHELPEQPVLSIRDRRPRNEIPEFMGQAFGILFRHLGMHRETPSGPPFAIYHEFGPDEIDAEICVPVEGTYPATEPVKARVLPAALVARTVHVGPYDLLAEAYEAISTWVAAHPYRTSGPVRERYLNGPGDGVTPSAYRTEVELPITRLEVAVLA